MSNHVPSTPENPGTPENIAQWLASGNSLNPLHNLAVVNAKLSNALARALNLQKSIVEDITDQINRISELSTRINSYKSTSATPPAEADFGKSKEEAKELLDLLVSEGGIDKDKLTKYYTAAATGIPKVAADVIGGWAQALNGKSESLSNKSQQEQLRLQTFSNRYTQASDQASSVLQKDAQAKGTIINNSRGLS